ncbi:hypothetical protein Cocul_02327 [Corynebacterium oculi]|uniref:Uncharacterized protein n=1 Tax=Corynebacterium oculi TaxID=1544416 RepID=A0A0Q1DTG0_9CORY|nr:hypothetical protein Cocul_02327 [Corynebacterium oculi]
MIVTESIKDFAGLYENPDDHPYDLLRADEWLMLAAKSAQKPPQMCKGMLMDQRDTIINALGTARLRPYLAETGGNKKHALRLYRWSIELSSAVHES